MTLREIDVQLFADSLIFIKSILQWIAYTVKNFHKSETNYSNFNLSLICYKKGLDSF